MDRRTVLRSGTLLTLGAITEKTFSSQGTRGATTRITRTGDPWWSTFAHDAANTGSGTGGPSSKVQPAWRAEYEEVLYSPAVADGTLFLPGAQGIDALDLSSGDRMWRFSESDQYFTETPAVLDGTVYCVTADSRLYALDTESSVKQWQFESGKNMSAPTVVGDSVFVGIAESLIAMNAEDGTERWSTPVSGNSVYPPAVADDAVYVTDQYGPTLKSVNIEDGTERWSVDLGGGSAPAVGDGTVYVGGAGGPRAVDISSGSVKWHNGSIDHTSRYPPAVTDGTVIVKGGNLAALDAASGEQLWKRSGVDAVTVASGTVFAVDETDCLLALSLETGEPEWRYELQNFDRARSIPIPAAGAVYLVGREDLARIHRVYALSPNGEGAPIENGPQPSFTVSPSEPTVRDTITADASASTDPDGRIESFEWDIDDDGEFERTGPTWSQSFSEAEDLEVTLRVTNEEDESATLSKTVSVGYPPVQRSKLDVARRIDDASVLSAIECDRPDDFATDADLAESLIKDLEAAVADGRIDPSVADEAIDRLRATEAAAEMAITRFGPGVPEGVAESNGINVARELADTALGFVARLVFVGITSKLPDLTDTVDVVPKSAVLDQIGNIAMEKALSIVRYVLGGTGSQFVDIVMQRSREESRGLIQDIRNGVTTTAEGVRNEIQSIAETIAGEITDALRAQVEFDDFTLTLPAVAQCPESPANVYELASPGSGLGVFDVLGSMTVEKLSVESVADGLEADTEDGVQAALEHETFLDETLTGARQALEDAREYDDRELDVFDVFVDAIRDNEDSVKNGLDFVGGMVNLVGGYVFGLGVDAFIDSAAVFNGLFVIEGIQRVTAAAGASALLGRRVPYYV